MTATVIPLTRKITDTKELPPAVVAACHALWDALEDVEPADADAVMAWTDAMYAIPRSVYDEVRAAKELREDAIRVLDVLNGDEPEPA